MKRWEVRTRVTMMRYYHVNADNMKAAEEASCNVPFDHEEEENEETMEVTEIVESDVSVSSPDRTSK